MWKRRLSSFLLLLLFCLWALGAQSSDSKWEALDDQALLQEAASVIEKLKILNEDLKKEASEALRESRELSAQLKALRSEKEALLKDLESLQTALEKSKIESAESEKMQLELVTALRTSEASWRSYKEEVEAKILRARVSGLVFELGLGIVLIMISGVVMAKVF